MSENYSEEDKRVIEILIGRLFVKVKKNRLSYRQMKSLLRVKSHVTIYRWLKRVSCPSQTNIYHIKKFLGYIKA